MWNKYGSRRLTLLLSGHSVALGLKLCGNPCSKFVSVAVVWRGVGIFLPQTRHLIAVPGLPNTPGVLSVELLIPSREGIHHQQR